MTWLNDHHLYYFRVIAREGSIARAAQKLRLGQPTLSTQLKNLEDSLGHKLFDRKNRKLLLTAAGETALEYANEVFRLGDEMMEVLQAQGSNRKRLIQVGVMESVPRRLVLDLISQAHQMERSSLSLVEGKQDDLFRELLAHRVDLLLSSDAPPIGDENGIVIQLVDRSQVVVYAHPKWMGLKEKFPESLQNQSLILPPQSSRLRRNLEYYFRTHQIKYKTAVETQDSGLQILLGESGVGLLPISELAARDSVQEGKLIPLGKLTQVFEEVWLISANRRMEDPSLSLLSKTFCNELKSL
jgi:LysR family transcriptional activator of nhaA